MNGRAPDVQHRRKLEFVDVFAWTKSASNYEVFDLLTGLIAQ
jgi:hypothetical protein